MVEQLAAGAGGLDELCRAREVDRLEQEGDNLLLKERVQAVVQAVFTREALRSVEREPRDDCLSVLVCACDVATDASKADQTPCKRNIESVPTY